jgi:hypothetical protein
MPDDLVSNILQPTVVMQRLSAAGSPELGIGVAWRGGLAPVSAMSLHIWPAPADCCTFDV